MVTYSSDLKCIICNEICGDSPSTFTNTNKQPELQAIHYHCAESVEQIDGGDSTKIRWLNYKLLELQNKFNDHMSKSTKNI